MDASVALLGLLPTLHFYASGAVTYLGAEDEPRWDDEPIFAVAA